ncbi:glycopeptide antibiotics resistance protein [Keratinibaculum paraultunense]|jgi:glycopeptide antibiotics resistance protein|uniref:Glycopeptide antibiotics resistance protein n=1 Tax=Keratinibaculum paraultunense TaxID=1278232 RepID=A0A4R3KRV9_9FIRM|nr:VanZ family protein [Keratinibaculum paraultunense]QQY79690.1 VanZ family protein [Keratinibaculum paraultunense]TCS87116.1 glycopeptide antibiotics resistance protein [Keratinibaculum paraultunense]
MDYLINFIILVLIYFLFFYKKWNKKPKKTLIINTLMYTYIVMVLFVTLMPLPIPFLNGTNNLFLETVNLIPFRDLRLNYYGAVREIFLNIIMMIPFGFLYPIIRKVGILKTVTVVFLFSLTIESTQLLSAFWGGLASRSFDVTDLITNTFGGLVGYLFFSTLKPIIFKILNEQ